MILKRRFSRLLRGPRIRRFGRSPSPDDGFAFSIGDSEWITASGQVFIELLIAPAAPR
jgi:hypothetical protein